ncbi:MAG: hypothetical protein HKN04_10730 [Rhodothermaceae bacterium]|nr:hypothetical protein [Rhodothermaceae bacterium]
MKALTMKALPLLLLLLAPALAAQTTSSPSVGSAPIPEWVLDEMAQMIGRWEADNSAYQSDNEPFDAYGIEWMWGLGQKSVVGRLFAIQDGEDIGSFWQFRQYWHPGEGKVIAFQIGSDGSVGIGEHVRTGDNQSETLQTFYDPTNGSTYRTGHRTEFRDGAQHTQSFNVDENGTWTERRSYVFRKVD